MIAQAGAVMRHPSARVATRRAQLRAASSLGWPALAWGAASAIGYQDVVGALKLAAGAFAGAAVTLAILNYQDSQQPEAPAVEAAVNETVIYRRDRPTLASAESH